MENNDHYAAATLAAAIIQIRCANTPEPFRQIAAGVSPKDAASTYLDCLEAITTERKNRIQPVKLHVSTNKTSHPQ